MDSVAGRRAGPRGPRARPATDPEPCAITPANAASDCLFSANTPYINTIPADRQPIFPGSREIERRIKSILRWNAMAMVVRANRAEEGIGGHISTYASAATLYEIAFNHFLRAPDGGDSGDQVYFQGHASPGILRPAPSWKAGSPRNK